REGRGRKKPRPAPPPARTPPPHPGGAEPCSSATDRRGLRPRVGSGIRHRAERTRTSRRCPPRSPLRPRHRVPTRLPPPRARPRAPGSGVPVTTNPRIRKLAKDLGVDLSRVPPTGPIGDITRDDVI